MCTSGVARELTLMLIDLTSWLEEPGPVRRCWKELCFEILDSLTEDGLVSDSRGAKTLYLTPTGKRQARELLSKYGFGPEDQ